MNVLVIPFETLGVTSKTATLGGTFVANVYGDPGPYYGWCGANVWSSASFRPIELVSKSAPEPSEELVSGGSTHRTAGWIQLQDGNWKYRGENGRFVTGWQKIDGTWYYLKNWGGMAAGTTTPDGYQVDWNGAWIRA